MNKELTFDEYKQKVTELGQTLIKALASVSMGDLNVAVEIPDDIEIFTELATGLDFVIDDLKELAKERDRIRMASSYSLPDSAPISATSDIPTRPLPPLIEQPVTVPGRSEIPNINPDIYMENVSAIRGLVKDFDEEPRQKDDWLPAMSDAVSSQETAYEGNGDNQHNLALPIQLQDQTIGVLGFSRSGETPWNEEQISTVEAIVEQVGLALENQRLFEQTQSALSETDILYQASAELNTAQAYHEILFIIKRYTRLGQNASTLIINLFNTPWSEELIPESVQVLARIGSSKDMDLDQYNLSAEMFHNSVLKNDQITHIKDLSADTRVSVEIQNKFVAYYGAKSLTFIPMVVGGQWIGFINALYDSEIEISEADIRRATAIATQASVSVQNLGLLEETARRARQLETAQEIAREATSTLDLDALLDRAVNLIHDRFGYYFTAVFLKETGNAIVKAATGDAGRYMMEEGLTIDLLTEDSVIANVISNGQPLVINDVQDSPIHSPHALLPDTKAELGIPLKVGNRIIGMLNVQSRSANAFSDDEISILQTLADQIAVGTDNARSFALSQLAVEEMREADRLKSEFLANMSHELRTPLNSIIGFSRVILKGIDGPINDLQQQDLEAIHSSGQHLLDMINNILDLSKIEAGKMEISIEEVPLDDIFESVIATTRGLIKEKPIQLINNTSGDLPTVSADRTRVRQIMLNLLQNASKFTDEGSITVNLHIETNDQNQAMAVISVADTGIGISQVDQIKLFERFSQVDSSLTRKVGGSGLGLSISKRLVEMQNGNIWLESIPGSGTTFFFSLPIVGQVDPSILAKPVSEVEKEEKQVVLAIENDQKIVDLYRRYLDGHGYMVIGHTLSQGAVERAKELSPAVITLDTMMPENSGWKILQALQQDPATKDIPILICSIQDQKEKAESHGIQNYLVKPILENDLVSAITKITTAVILEKPTLLVIDPDPNFIEFISSNLNLANDYELIVANDGLKGIQYLETRKPDGIILELNTTDMDGFSIIETIRSNPSSAYTPILTFSNQAPTVELGLKLGEKKMDVTFKTDTPEMVIIDIIKQFLTRI